MIRRARVAVYDGDLAGRYERRLVVRMEDEGWLAAEQGSWSGERLYRATTKALARV